MPKLNGNCGKTNVMPDGSLNYCSLVSFDGFFHVVQIISEIFQCLN